MANKNGNESLNSDVAADGDTNQSLHSKDKLMHSLFSAIEHLLPIDHKKTSSATNNEMSQAKKMSSKSNSGSNKDVDEFMPLPSSNNPDLSLNTLQSTQSMANGENNDSAGMTKHKSSSDSVTRSNSFLSSLNSILQSNGHVISTPNPKIRNPHIKLDPLKRGSIFSDSEVVLNRKRHESPLKDSSLKSIDFNHVSRNLDNLRDEDDEDDDYDDEAEFSEVGDIHEEPDPELEIKDENLKDYPAKNDDYIIQGGNLASSQENKDTQKRFKPHRVVSDVPKRSSPLVITNIQHNNSDFKAKEASKNASETNDGSKSKASKCKRAGTITVAPLALTKLKSRSRGASISKQDLLDSRNQSHSSTSIYNLNREKSNVSSSSKEEDNHSSSDDQEEVFSCALQKDILMQGKLYLSKDTIKFRSKIFGMKSDISFLIKDIVQLEKKFTAMLFPNGIIIKTVDRDYIFASFLNRDAVFEKIMKRWGDVIMMGIQENNKFNSDSDKYVEEKQNKSKNGERKSIQRNSIISKGSEYDRRDSMKKGKGGVIKFKLPEIFDSQGDGLKLKSPVKQLIHGITVSDGSENEDDDEEDENDADQDDESYSSGDENMTSDDEYEPEAKKHKVSGSSASGTAVASTSFGPSTGKPYSPDLEPYSKDVDVSDDVINSTTLGIVFKILSDKMDVILDKGGNYSISKIEKLYPYGDDDSKLKANEFKREYSFTKPLNSSLGPKETVCQVTDLLTEVDLTKWFVIQQKTLTPDVPSGKSFSVITNIIVYWSGETDVTIKSYTKVIWTGKSWIKGPVENGNSSGQKQAMHSLIKEVQALSDDYKPSPKASVTKKKTSKSKAIKKSVESKKATELDHRTEKAIAQLVEQPETSESFVASIMHSKNLSTYLMWAIMAYLLLDKIFHKQDVVIYNKFGSDSLQNSESDIWSWVLERTDGISAGDISISNSSSAYSFDTTTLKNFSKQELFGIKELKEKELKIIENMMNKP